MCSQCFCILIIFIIVEGKMQKELNSMYSFWVLSLKSLAQIHKGSLFQIWFILNPCY